MDEGSSQLLSQRVDHFLKESSRSTFSPSVDFRQHSTYCQKHGSGEGLDSGKNKDIWNLTYENIRGKGSLDRLLHHLSFPQASIQSGVWSLDDTFQKHLILSGHQVWGVFYLIVVVCVVDRSHLIWLSSSLYSKLSLEMLPTARC